MKTIAITMGDPLGVGPEIAVQTLADPALRQQCKMILVGDRSILAQAAALCGIADFEAKFGGEIEHVPCNLSAPQAYAGTVQAEAGRTAYACIERAHELCTQGVCQAVATAPINKESLKAAQVPYIGHTEIFAGLTGAADPLTMFETTGLRIFFLTRHLSLRQACDQVTANRVLDYIRRCTAALRNIGIQDGTLAVAGLNPHSGEHGLFGTEEMDAIVPAVAKAKEEGYRVEGPVSADSVFHQAHIGRYAAVLSLYHDQGHIAAKTLDFHRTISVTHGLPYLRTSVDHGTAFDIAWKGIADPISMKEATRLAALYA
ncbi:MAG: 4-hydroxythreonine-4-phosphate dehydrogenase PdxA [Clostridia bacterium]|nr:4-hydroxythreonine-4-phosphate dehydrogenase PdxA [Clostridia bacterium]